MCSSNDSEMTLPPISLCFELHIAYPRPLCCPLGSSHIIQNHHVGAIQQMWLYNRKASSNLVDVGMRRPHKHSHCRIFALTIVSTLISASYRSVSWEQRTGHKPARRFGDSACALDTPRCIPNIPIGAHVGLRRVVSLALGQLPRIEPLQHHDGQDTTFCQVLDCPLTTSQISSPGWIKLTDDIFSRRPLHVRPEPRRRHPLSHKFIALIRVHEHFGQIHLVDGAVAVFDDPVVGAPGGVFGRAGTVAVAGAVHGRCGVQRWERVDWVGREGRYRRCTVAEMDEDEG